MIYEVELDGDMYDHAQFRQMIEEQGGEVINEYEANEEPTP